MVRRNKRQAARFLPCLAACALLGCGQLGVELEGPIGTAAIWEAPQLDWSAGPGLAQTGDAEEAVAAVRDMALTVTSLELEYRRQLVLESNIVEAKSAELPPLWRHVEPPEGPTFGPPSADPATGQLSSPEQAKTDGVYIYGLVGGELVIVPALPYTNPPVLARVSVRGTPWGLIRHDTRIAVLSTLARADADPEQLTGTRPVWGDSMTCLTVVDATVPEQPVVLEEQLYEGTIRAARAVGGNLYVTLWNPLVLPDQQLWPQDLSASAGPAAVDAAFAELLAANSAAIDTIPAEELLPRRFDTDEGGEIDLNSARTVASLGSVWVPDVFSGAGITTVVNVPIDGDEYDLREAWSLLGDWATVRASHQALYLASTNWGYYWLWPPGIKPEIVTHVHKLALEDSGAAAYIASGEVPGYPLEGAALDEHDDRLRVVTTAGELWSGWGATPQLDAFLWVLEPDGARLRLAGQLDDLGGGAPVRQVHFAGDMAYVERLDDSAALRVLDLSEPSSPTPLGEIAKPGALRHVQPLDEEHVLTLAQGGSDPRMVEFAIHHADGSGEPVTLHTEFTKADGDSWSEVRWGQQALNYFAEQQILTLPMGLTLRTDEGWWHYRPQLELYRVDPATGITLVGAISHGDMVVSGCNEQAPVQAEIRQSIFIDRFLWSISDLGLEVHDTEALEQGAVGALPLAGSSPACAAE